MVPIVTQHLESELVEEILNTGGLSVTLGSLCLVFLLEDLLHLLTGLTTSGDGN